MRSTAIALARIVTVLGIDRSSLSRVLPWNGSVEVTHSHARPGLAPAPKFLPARDVNPWALAKALADEPIVFSRMDELPPEAEVDKQIWRRAGLPGAEFLSYQFAFNRLDMMSIHEVQGVVDEELDRWG